LQGYLIKMKGESTIARLFYCSSSW